MSMCHRCGGVLEDDDVDNHRDEETHRFRIGRPRFRVSVQEPARPCRCQAPLPKKAQPTGRKYRRGR